MPSQSKSIANYFPYKESITFYLKPYMEHTDNKQQWQRFSRSDHAQLSLLLSYVHNHHIPYSKVSCFSHTAWDNDCDGFCKSAMDVRLVTWIKIILECHFWKIQIIYFQNKLRFLKFSKLKSFKNSGLHGILLYKVCFHKETSCVASFVLWLLSVCM